MGGKRASSGKYLHICATLLICLAFCNCSALRNLGDQDEPRQHLTQAQKLFALGDFDASLMENRKALVLSADRPPEDEALFNIGLIYAHPENSKRDLIEAIAVFQGLIQNFPESPWRNRAIVCVGIISDYKKSKVALEDAVRARTKISGENEKLKKSLTAAAEENEKSKQALAAAVQESAKLKNMIDEWKRVDKELEGKKRGKAR
jgi:hypothetical protein